MHDVAILGAGELGGALAHVLARRDLFATITLVDETGEVAAGKALDITQSSALDGFTTRVVGTTALASASRCSVLIIADCATRGEWKGDDGLMLLKRWSPPASGGLVLCAGSEQRTLVERGVRELRIPRLQLFGSAPEALVAAIRAFVALEANQSPRDVALTVLGVPPSQTVVPWDDATIGGIAATRVLDVPARRRLASRITLLWPPGPYALAWAASKAVEAILGKSQQIVSCFVAPDDSMGRRTRAAAVPTRLGAAGIASVEMPGLTVHDRVALDNATLL